MSGKNGRAGLVHTNLLQSSDQDTIALADAVESRFLDLCGSWERIRGEKIPIPESMDRALLLWRKCVARFRKGDFRNTADELRAIKEVAQWSVDAQRQLRNQPTEKVKWKE